MAAELQLFHSLPERERALLEAKARRLSFPAEAYLYHEGQPGDAVYVVLTGRVGIWSGGERGEPVLLTVLGAGEMFGEMAFLSDERLRTATAQALSYVEVVQILRTDLEQLRHRYPRIAEVFIAHLLRLVQRLTTQVAELSELDGATRVYRQLIRLGQVYERTRAGAELPVSQQQLASLSGVGLRVVNKVLNQAATAGVLETGRGRITVRDWAVVRRRAGVRARGA